MRHGVILISELASRSKVKKFLVSIARPERILAVRGSPRRKRLAILTQDGQEGIVASLLTGRARQYRVVYTESMQSELAEEAVTSWVKGRSFLDTLEEETPHGKPERLGRRYPADSFVTQADYHLVLASGVTDMQASRLKAFVSFIRAEWMVVRYSRAIRRIGIMTPKMMGASVRNRFRRMSARIEYVGLGSKEILGEAIGSWLSFAGSAGSSPDFPADLPNVR